MGTGIAWPVEQVTHLPQGDCRGPGSNLAQAHLLAPLDQVSLSQLSCLNKD